MLDKIEILYEIENKKKIKCLHNEVKIIYELLKHGPTSSLAIMRKTNRSISAHNSDLKRLMALGAIRQVEIAAARIAALSPCLSAAWACAKGDAPRRRLPGTQPRIP